MRWQCRFVDTAVAFRRRINLRRLAAGVFKKMFGKCMSNFRLNDTRKLLVASVAGLALNALPARAGVVLQNLISGDFTLHDGSTIATINSTTGTVDSLVVGGVNELAQQSFFYRIGQSGPEKPLGSLQLTGASLSGGESPNNLFMNFTGPGFTVSVSYTIIGGSNRTSPAQLQNLLFFNGTSQTPVDLHVFQYDRFTLGGAGRPSTVAIDLPHDQVVQTGVGSRSTTAKVTPAVSGTPGVTSEYQVGVNSAILKSLTDSLPTTLNNTAGPIGPGNVEFALESDTSLGNLGVFPVVSTDTINPGVPVPAAFWMGLSTLGCICAAGAVRGKARKA